MSPILPGKTIGILGGGQLGRMLCLAARYMGYRSHVYCPDGPGPASQAADAITSRPWDDLEALRHWLDQVEVVTVEFENVPAACMELAESIKPTRPSARILRIAQHRQLEKQSLADAGLPVTPFRSVKSHAELQTAWKELKLPLVLKTVSSGYDGKGQAVIRTLSEADSVFSSFQGSELVAEQWIPYEREVSVLVARDTKGSVVLYPPIENHHRNHILDVSLAPAPGQEGLREKLFPIATTAAERLGLVGLLCIEFFVVPSGEVLINEIAPRPHNSGHLTMEAFACDQFQQLIRAVCGFPVVNPVQTRPAAMVNLLGELWEAGEPDWCQALSVPEVSLHLYGKPTARRGRKMGHLTALGDSLEEAVARAKESRQRLCPTCNHGSRLNEEKP